MDRDPNVLPQPFRTTVPRGETERTRASSSGGDDERWGCTRAQRWAVGGGSSGDDDHGVMLMLYRRKEGGKFDPVTLLFRNITIPH